MGQQQLLLLVLGIVIVGLAVVVGIQAFSENQEKSNADAINSDLARFVSEVHAFLAKPEQVGGGSLTNLGAYALGYDVDANGHYKNPNALYMIDSDPSSNAFRAAGCSNNKLYVLYSDAIDTSVLDLQVSDAPGDCASELNSL